MSNTPIGNEEAMAQVKALMEAKERVEEVNQGDKATNVVSIEYEANSGKLYKGKIQFKRPNIMESMSMGGRKTQILQQAGVVDRELADDGVMMMAQSLSTLETVAVKRPEWLINMGTIEDTDVIFHVYGKYREWDLNFRLDGTEA
jgi:hypothetical protein